VRSKSDAHWSAPIKRIEFADGYRACAALPSQVRTTGRRGFSTGESQADPVCSTLWLDFRSS
jgi:hypothetical protein